LRDLFNPKRPATLMDFVMITLKHRFPILLLILFWLSIPFASASENSPLHLTSNTRHASLSGHLALHVDAQGTQLFDVVKQTEFAPLKEFRSAGYTSDTHWYRFTLARDKEAQGDWVLALGTPYLNDVGVWVELADGQFREYQLGSHVAYEKRPLQSRLFALHVDLPDTKPVEVYVRVHSKTAINFSAEVWRPDDFIANETRINLYNGMYFGVLGIIILLFAILGAWLRDVGMLAYAGYVTTLLFLFLAINGYTAVVFSPASSWITDVVLGGGVIGGLAMAPFMCVRLLDLKRHFPRISYLYLSISLTSLFLLFFSATSYYQVIAYLVVQVSIILSITNNVLLAILWLRQRTIELLLYLYAFITLFLGALVQFTMVLGWVPQNILTSNAYQAALLLNVLIMGLGLAFRIRQIQRDEALAKQEVAVSNRRAEEQRNFVAMLSHEFRNPLAAIDRAAQMIQLKLHAMPPAEAERMTNIRAGVNTLSSLVDNFLMSEALDHQALALSIEDCALRPLLENVVQTLGETVGGRVLLTVTPPAATYPLDHKLIGMAVSNLLGNALRYSPQDKKVELSAFANEEGLAIRVTDHGYGLSEEELASLGMPYYRANSSVGKKGSGLGYHFSRRIVEAHGGNIQAYSPPESGLEVVIRLPVKK
jgi:signal transduction histidine kinase